MVEWPMLSGQEWQLIGLARGSPGSWGTLGSTRVDLVKMRPHPGTKSQEDATHPRVAPKDYPIAGRSDEAVS